MENNWIKIRESKLENKFELWNSKSSKLYGIDKLSKNIIENNIDNIKDECALEVLIDLLNDKSKLVFDTQHFDIIEDGFNYLILSKDNVSQFVINQTTVEICKYFNVEHLFSEALEHFLNYFKSDENIEEDIANCIIELVLYKVILIV